MTVRHVDCSFVMCEKQANIVSFLREVHLLFLKLLAAKIHLMMEQSIITRHISKYICRRAHFQHF